MPGAMLDEQARLRSEFAALAPHFPEDPLDNDTLLEILSAYRRESLEDRQTIEGQYATVRERFLRSWRDLDEPAQHGIAPAAPSERSARLKRELAEIRAYVESLETQAQAVRSALPRALEATAEAAGALDAARNKLAATPTDSRHTERTELERRLAAAEAGLQAARDALARGTERPLTASRLASQATAVAREVEQELERQQALPGLLDRQCAEYERLRQRLQRDYAAILDDIESLTERTAPACWQDVRGLGTALSAAVRRANDHHAAVQRLRAVDSETSAEAVEAAAAEIGAALAALSEAGSLLTKIQEIVRSIVDVSQQARQRVDATEHEIDRSATAIQLLTDSDEQQRQQAVLSRATDLLAQARHELAQPRPDWLAIERQLERSRALAAECLTAASGTAESMQKARWDVLASEQARAKGARDRAWSLAWSVEPGALSVTTRELLDHAEAAYQRAVSLELDTRQHEPSRARADAIQAASEAFRHAYELASEVCRVAERELNKPAWPARLSRPYDVGDIVTPRVLALVTDIFAGDGSDGDV